MSGHDSIPSPSLQYPGAVRGTPGHDGFDLNTSKRRREGAHWEGNTKRTRRDDFDQPDAATSQYSSPNSLYDPQLSAHHFQTSQHPHSTKTSTPYPQQPVAFANAASTLPPHNLDPAITTYPAPPPPPPPAAQHQFRDQDQHFAAYPVAQGQAHFLNPWNMAQHTPDRPYQPSPDNNNYQPSNDYASSSMPSQQPYNASISAQEWTQPSYNYTGGTDHWNYQIDEPTVYGEDASLHLKLQSIPTLDNLSTQIIMNLAKPSLPDILLLTTGRNYEESQAYFTRRNLFDQTRKVFTRISVFIDLHACSHMFSASQQEVIRKANRATFISSILEGNDISFYDLDSLFLDTFVPTGQRLLKWQGTVFLELKTQAYIAALMNNDGPAEVLLNELFPNDLDQRILARHPDAANITPSEQDFLDRARSRKQYLLSEPPYEALHSLRSKYGWQDFLREFASCVNKNVEAIINNPARTPSSVGFSPGVPRLSQSPATRHPYYSPHVAQQRRQSIEHPGSIPPQSLQPPPTHHQLQNLQQHDARATASASATPDPAEGMPSPHPKAKSGKPAKTTGGTGTPRQPWRQEEEDALLAGLAEVKGPHWSQILSLYGRGGSVSEVLKDRNQIQLKDKARNLKLWYLKMGNEVPQCLRGVTGELRKRGGARVRAALGLTDDDDGPPKKSQKASPLGKAGGGGANQGGSTHQSGGSQIDPSLGE